MNKYKVTVILKPDIKEKRIGKTQKNIINQFENNTRIKREYYLGKKKLNIANEKYSEGIYLQLEVKARKKKMNRMIYNLRENQNVIDFSVTDGEDGINKLPILRKVKQSYHSNNTNNVKEPSNKQAKTVHILVNKSRRIPFTEPKILAVSEDSKKILEKAKEKVYEYVYKKGLHTAKELDIIEDVENELIANKKVEFTFPNDNNIWQEIAIEEMNLI